ncbi:hypothetical protein GCK72_026250 [Caenorhabditis remanei]|uniref:Uncharacterized protein n=1 Tax=Caenorhabditis remanei TaxID=31234 RepID=A0A6A5G4X2_CAERE|nr:hypothetical protein GCK72_026250 [Caenorhabditis remanei]KAF1749781.1 hypothetical protein GCK72_026250 [Caenorhabditis remanei]
MNSTPSFQPPADFAINPPISETDYGTVFQDLHLSPSPTMLANEIFFPSNLITQTPQKQLNRQDAETTKCAENCVQKVQVLKPKREISGKKMIKMNELPEKPKRKRAPRKKKIEEREVLAFRGMEKFVCVYFCKECHENTTYDGKTLTIKLCDQCCQRVNKF